jgi:thymidylate kinase
MKTLFVNLFGGPGTGKSTIASHLFALLKWQGYNCELVSEYAKQIVWEKSFSKLNNQIYVFAKQHNKQFILNNEVQIVLTDSPLLFSLIYGSNCSKEFHSLVHNEYQSFNNLNIFLKRQKAYNPKGRTQNEEEAKSLDIKIKFILADYKFYEEEASHENVQNILKMIIEEYNKINS